MGRFGQGGGRNENCLCGQLFRQRHGRGVLRVGRGPFLAGRIKMNSAVIEGKGRAGIKQLPLPYLGTGERLVSLNPHYSMANWPPTNINREGSWLPCLSDSPARFYELMKTCGRRVQVLAISLVSGEMMLIMRHTMLPLPTAVNLETPRG